MIIEEKCVLCARVFFIVLFVFAMAGCATTQSDIQRADEFCENNGGVYEIQSKYNNTVRVQCNDTAKFKFKGGAK